MDGLEQIKTIFYEESFENLAMMEAALIKLSPDNYTAEDINIIFRGMHSIKGGSSMFSLIHITELTHDAESLLDKIRNKKSNLTNEIINTLLETVDLLTAIFKNLKDNKEYISNADFNNLRKKISELLEAPQTSKRKSTKNIAIETVEENQNKKTYARDLTSIQVSTEKVDLLINLLGELVITQSILSQMGKTSDQEINLTKLRQQIDQLSANSVELQQNMLSIRMVPIHHIFNRFSRMVRDISQQLNKKIQLKITGEQTELDKNYIETIADPIQHIVRNALDHGLESSINRKKQGKPETGTLHLNAYHQGGYIVIEISDDGAGLNKQKILNKALKLKLIQPDETLTDAQVFSLIFKPGFTTGEEVTALSGRGVGLDVVKNNVEELGGQIEVKSIEGQGTTFSLLLPLTLAILDGQLFRIGNEIYILPLISILESVPINPQHIQREEQTQQEIYHVRDEVIPLIRLHQLFKFNIQQSNVQKILVIVDTGKHKMGLLVDELLEQQRVVIKSIEDNYRKIPGITAATILGNGAVTFIIDIAGIQRLAQQHVSGNIHEHNS